MNQNIIERIHDEIDIVQVISEHVPLSKKGQSFVGLCPFHPDKTPSMHVSASKQLYNCFSCGNKGDVITFISEFKKIPRTKAIAELAKRIGATYEASEDLQRYTDAQRKIIDALTITSAFYQNQLDININAPFGEYALRRGLDVKTRDRFKIGLALKNNALKPFLLARGHDEAVLINAGLINQSGHDFFSNRLVFALTNEWGDIVGFSGRTLDNNDSKYINSINSVVFSKQHLFYNLFHAKDSIAKTREVYVCEGQMDVIALVKSGFDNTVAIMGTALTASHLKHLPKGTKVILNFDSDAAGITATIKSVLLLLESSFAAYVVANENGKDADEIFSNGGPKAVAANLTRVASGLEYVYQSYAKKLVPNDATSANRLISDVVPFLALASELEREMIINQIAQKLSVDPAVVRAQVPTRRARKVVSDDLELQRERVAEEQPANSKFNRYSYALILTMVKKPSLISFYKSHRHTILWTERQLELIANFLAADESATPPALSQAAAARLETIKEGTFFVTSESELKELLLHVQKEYYDFFINRASNRLKNDLSPEEIDTILKTISEYKKKKEELE